jgi:hypothetical protein
MNRLIITEEEKSRILGMHQSATSRQYLMENTGYDSTQGPKVNDGPAAYNYFMGIVNKTKTLKKGTTWVGKNTYWVVTSDWGESQTGAILGERCDILMRGIVKRNGLYFDVSNDSESMLMNLAKTNADSFLNTLNGNEPDKWLSNTQTLKSVSTGTPGGNMALVGGLETFKKMVKNLPNKEQLLTNFINARKTKPSFGFGAVPQDQQDLYPPLTQTTVTPTKQPVSKP